MKPCTSLADHCTRPTRRHLSPGQPLALARREIRARRCARKHRRLPWSMRRGRPIRRTIRQPGSFTPRGRGSLAVPSRPGASGAGATWVGAFDAVERRAMRRAGSLGPRAGTGRECPRFRGFARRSPILMLMLMPLAHGRLQVAMLPLEQLMRRPQGPQLGAKHAVEWMRARGSSGARRGADRTGRWRTHGRLL